MPKVLITGSRGMLGASITRRFLQDSAWEVFGIDRGPQQLLPASRHFLVDLTQHEETTKALTQLKPDLIVHTAALVDLNLCETDPQTARAVHVEASANLATFQKDKTSFFHISTDSVFDGTVGNYKEDAEPHPLNAYAESKLEGEEAVHAANAKAVVVRTNIYGFSNPAKNSLAEWALGEWQKGKVVKGFSDVIFNPLYVEQLADLIKFLAGQANVPTVLHAGCKEPISKYMFIKKLAAVFGVDPALLSEAKSTDFASRIKRPLNTSLNCNLLSSRYPIPSIDEGIKQFYLNYKEMLNP